MDVEKVLRAMPREFKTKMNNTGNAHSSGKHKGCLEFITSVIYILAQKTLQSGQEVPLQLFLGLVGLIFTSDTVIPTLNF